MLGYPLGWMIAAGLFFLLLLAAALSTVDINGHLKRIGQNDEAQLHVRALLGLIHYQWELPGLRMKGAGVEVKEEAAADNLGGSNQKSATYHVNSHSIAKSFESFNQLLGQTRDLLGWARKTLGHIVVSEWSWHTVVGTGDAVWTAMATGGVWSAKTTSIGLLSQLVRLTGTPLLSVTPMYNQVYFATEGKFRARIRFGYAIFAGIALMYRLKKNKGIPQGLLSWQRILMRA
ncbi:DUF2953 domain-containing protein [Paenibacillus nasutitermitis]|uniref:DUF2953 domain-containing protein n=1 Tax=Paenibacillus nasutitermitis TaxID=1652958 RepID=A0A916Z034_9BACL|nr:DUF2953 domain-containing protein [Paenibacillus nasutitermitis]GGD69540.1 hypothetical protein GCM10010911_29320 [Paenibacillus nasutitermitis]